MVAYAVYVLPILGFIAQLATPPEETYKLESKALRIMVPGPYRLALDEDLQQSSGTRNS